MIGTITDFSSLTSAFQRVKENHGCAGVDGVTIGNFESDLNRNLSMLLNDLRGRGISPCRFSKSLLAKAMVRQGNFVFRQCVTEYYKQQLFVV